MSARRLRTHNKGFTLVELMIVITIIVILVSILIPNFIRARSRSQLSVCTSNLKNIASGVEMYSTDNDGRYPTQLEQLTPKYLRTIPKCPVAGSDSYSSSFTSSVVPDTYEFYCDGNSHLGFAPVDYPRYDPSQGLVER